METAITQQEEKNKKRGMTVSIAVHIALIILALIPILTFPDPPPGQEGILVNLGLPDVGEGDDNAGPATPSEPERSEPEEVVEQPDPEPTPPEPTPPVKTAEPAPQQKEVVKTEDPAEVALREKKAREEAERREREREEAERKRQEQVEAERKRKAEEEARRKAAAEEARKKAEADKLKDQIGGLFGDGKGKGNTGKPGNQGDPNGDPDASKLEGISTGSGTVGGGLGNRGGGGPKITDNSQKQGTVVVRVCVDNSGKVVSAEYTQRGSSTSDATLKRLAVSNAKQWKFSKGSVDKQCGTITYRFRVQ